MSQPTLTTYGGRLRDLGYAGGVVDENPFVAETLQNDLAPTIDFGVAVARSASDNTCKAIALDADKIIGISMRHAIKPAPGNGQANANAVTYAQYEAVPVMREGWIYAVAFENVTRGDQVLSITAQAGKLGGVTGGGAGAGRVVVPGATWEGTVAAGGLGVIRINN